MVSGSKLKCPSKVSWEVSFSLYYSVIYGNCLGNVVVGIEKCGKMWKNELVARFYYTTYTVTKKIVPIVLAIPLRQMKLYYKESIY